MGEGPPGGQAEDAAAATARSGVLGAAIQARLDGGDAEGAKALFTQVGDQLDPEHAAPLQGQINTMQRFDSAKNYGDSTAPAPAASLEEIDARHPAAMQQVEADDGSSAATPVRYGSGEFTPVPPNVGSQSQQTRPPLIPPARYSLPKNNIENAPGRGVAPLVEPAPGSPAYEAANAQAAAAEADLAPGEVVVLPNGERVEDKTPEQPSNASPTGQMMSPVPDLAPVAAAGRSVGDTYRLIAKDDPAGATAYLIQSYFQYVGTGGLYDYQRRGSQISGGIGGGFAHRRQFRSVSNFNVGLFCQQAGLTLEGALVLAGTYSTLLGSPDRGAPYNLKRETAKFIQKGYEAGQSGAFNPGGQR